MKKFSAMKINWFYILIFGANVIVCLPQSNQHESSLDVTAENDDKSTEDERNLGSDKLKDKEENTTDANNIKNEVQEITTKIVNTNKKVDVLNMSESMHTNKRLLPIYYGQAEQAVPHRWLPAPPRYIIPIAPRASEPVFTPTYDTPFEKDVSEPEVVAEPHINEPVIKTPSNNPIDTIYMVPPQIAYTPGSAGAIIPTPYLAPIPIDTNGYNSQETGLPTKPWLYSSSFVQPRYFRINDQQPYYRNPVHPLPRHNPVNVYPPPFNYDTTLYQEPLQPTTLEERYTGELHERGPGKNAGDNNDGRKDQINVPENLADFVRNIPNNYDNNDGYPIYYPSKPHNTENHSKNAQANFESPVIDTTKISGYVNPDAVNDFNHFNHGYPMYFPLNFLERNPQVTYYSPYRNPGPKEKLQNTVNNSDDPSSSHNDNNVTHEPEINGRNHQTINNPDQNVKTHNDYEILHARKIRKSLSDTTDISSSNRHLNHAPADSKNFANESKSVTLIERKDNKQEFDYVYNTKQHDSSEGNVSKEAIVSNKPVLNDTIDSKESAMDTHIIFMDNTEKLSIVSLKTDKEEKNQESLNITNKKEDKMVSTEIGTPESFENVEPNESTMESRSIYSNEFIHKDSTETKSTETTAKMNNDSNITIGTDIYEKDVIIETTQLQPSYNIEKEQYGDQDTGTQQIEASIDDSDILILNNSNRSTTGTKNDNIQIIKEENPIINRHEINSNQTNDVQLTYYLEKIHDDGGLERADDSVEVKIKKDDTKYNSDININQVENETAISENLNQKKSSENNDDEEDEKLNNKNDEQDNTKYKNTFSETKSDNSNSRESGENPDDRKPQIEDKRHDKENLDMINGIILNPETVESKNESNNNDVGYKHLEYPASEISTNIGSSQVSDEKSDKEQPQIEVAMYVNKENDNANNKHRILEIISNKNCLKDEIDISEKGSESNTKLDEYDDYDKNNKDLQKMIIENKDNDVKLSPHNPENIDEPEIERTDWKSYIDQDVNKDPLGDTHEKEDTWYNDKDDAGIDVNLNPKITENYEATKFKEQSGNYSNSENRSEDIDIKLVEEVATAIEKSSCPDQDILALSISDTNSNEDNDDNLNDANENNDDFDVISSASQITNKESIKFKTTCIRHPVDISMNDDSKKAAEPMRLEFYRKIFEYKNHNVMPVAVIQKNIRSFVYKNGTVVDVITATVWKVENDEKDELRTTKTINKRKKKNCKQN